MHHDYSNDLLNYNQFGFTPKKSAIDAALAVKEFLAEGMREGHIKILVGLDVKVAFDAAWWPSILKTLKEFKCPQNFYSIVKSYFSERTVIFSANSIQTESDVSKGCPQDSCCGPGFWNIQYNSLHNLEFSKRTKASSFADDLLIAISAETIREAENYANIEIIKISNWAKDKIIFNEQKSKVMVVTRGKRRENKAVSIYLNNKPLEQVSNIKYLGIFIDRKLNFREPITQTYRKCSTLIHALAKSAKLSWGLKHEVLKTIYKGAILPLMLYGVPVWIGAKERKCNKIIYSRVQRPIIIKIAKAYRTTSREALCTLTGLTPIVIKGRNCPNISYYRDRQNHQLDHEEEPKNWTQPADSESA